MKKLLCLALCLLMAVSAFAGCNVGGSGETTEAAVERSLAVGFGRADITPENYLKMPLQGLGDIIRYCTDVREPLTVTCIAFTDEKDNTILFFSGEELRTGEAFMWGRADVAKKTGIPAGNIMICSTHNHSTPWNTKLEEPGMKEYRQLIRDRMVEAAEAALADRKPSEMYIATAYPEKLNFIRHYLMSDGTYAGDNFGSFEKSAIVKNVAEPDNAMQLVKFTREGGKDVVMVNWQGHPRGHDEHRDSILSFSGKVVEYVEEKLDCLGMYILGASGNVNNSYRAKKLNLYQTYEEHANALADYAAGAAKDFKKVDIGTVQLTSYNCPCPTKENPKISTNVPLNVFSIGDVAVVTAPYEMFSENGVAIKTGSPFKMTVVATCANGACSYIPSIGTYDYNNKPDEVYEIMKTAYVPGTGETLADQFVSMLKTLYETK